MFGARSPCSPQCPQSLSFQPERLAAAAFGMAKAPTLHTSVFVAAGLPGHFIIQFEDAATALVERVILSTIEHQRAREERQNVDPSGHHARPDVPQLSAPIRCGIGARPEFSGGSGEKPHLSSGTISTKSTVMRCRCSQYRRNSSISMLTLPCSDLGVGAY